MKATEKEKRVKIKLKERTIKHIWKKINMKDRFKRKQKNRWTELKKMNK